MKKSTKIITTAISLVLVFTFMVVGIMAATTATAGISSAVSWSAEAGLKFTLDVWTYYSAEHYNSTAKSFPELSSHKIEQVVVDSATTNQVASGITKSLNATFIDTTDDGVNNPHELYYICCFNAIDDDPDDNERPHIEVAMTKIQNSSSAINVQLGTRSGLELQIGGSPINYIQSWTDKPSGSIFGKDMVFVLKLSLSNPNVSVSDFEVNVKFNVYRSAPEVDW